MVDSDGPFHDEEITLTFSLIESINHTLNEFEKGKYIDDKSSRIFCERCGKERNETRCLYHINAKGCHYCHLHTNIHIPGKEGAGI